MYNVLPTGRKTKSEPQTTQTYMPSNHMSQDIATIENMHTTYNFRCLLCTAHQSLRAFCRHAACFVCFGDHVWTNKGAVISIGHSDFKTFDANVFWGIIVSNCVTILWNISHACLECVFVQYFSTPGLSHGGLNWDHFAFVSGQPNPMRYHAAGM